MKYISLQEAFEIELNVLDDSLNKPKSKDTEWWLNRALEKFVKTRYSGINYKGLGFEQDQKRTDDLRTLVKTINATPSCEAFDDGDAKLFSVTLPNDYMFLLGDSAGIQPSNGIYDECWEVDDNNQYIVKYGDTIEATVETIDRHRANSLSEYRLKYGKAKPLRLIQGNKILLFTDGNYKVSNYRLTYLAKPKQIDIHSKPFDEYTDMPEHTHFEIVKIAAQMYIENQRNPRISTHNTEVQEME